MLSARKSGLVGGGFNAYGIDNMVDYKINYRESTGTIGEWKSGVKKNRPL